MNTKTLAIIFGIAVLAAIGYFVYRNYYKAPTGTQQVPSNPNAGPSAPSQTPSENERIIKYTNGAYGFEFDLPESWKGYTIVEEKWQGYAVSATGEGKPITEGPQLLLRHPEWTKENPRQDIPIMVFTLAQWNDMQADKFHIGAAPINPSELGRNDKYVFALPARYNYAFPTGYQEVEQILEGNPLHAFNV